MLHQSQQRRQHREFHHPINPINSNSRTQTQNKMDNKRNFQFRTLSGTLIHHQHQQIEDGDNENQTDLSTGLTFPTLWKKMTINEDTNEEAFPLQLEHHQHYQHHQHIILSPTSRSKQIAKGRHEMMEMIKNMPEASYELSLKDLVMEQQPTPQTHAGDDHLIMIDDATSSTIIPDAKRKKKTQVSRTKSMETNRPFLLNVFFPAVSLGSKKNHKKQSSKMSATTCSKVSPRPPVLIEVDQKKGFVDKECWPKRLSVADGESKNIIRSSDNIIEEESNGSRNSSINESCGRKTMGGILPRWWSFYKKIKSNKQNKSVQF